MSLLQVKNVSHSYNDRSLFNWNKRSKQVLSNVSFSIEEGNCFGLLGMSGAGKSTLGKIMLGLERPQMGQVLFEGQDMYTSDKRVQQQIRRNFQVVFQDSFSSVNPRMTAERIIAEPLENFESLTKSEMKRTIIGLLERVGLSEGDLTKYPHQFSGGQLQRVCIARAISTTPKLIVLDESVSSLDMVNKSLILELLKDLKVDFGLSYFFITHDIKAAYMISDQLGVLDKGELLSYYKSPHQFIDSEKAIIKDMLADHPRSRTIRTIG